MSSRTLEYIISAKNRTGMAISKAVRGFGKIRRAASDAFRHPLQTLARFKAQLAGLIVAAVAFAGVMKTRFKFESLTVQFSVLFKNMEQAKLHMQDLESFAAGTPFQMEGIAKASRSLHVFTDGVLGGVASLKKVGDAAGATGNKIEELSFWVGRAYSAISSGRAFGESAMRLQEMGILSGEARAEMER